MDREKIAPLTEDQIKHMVNRFLGWRLPENFAPDGGISFKATFNEHTAHPMKSEPVGTNLFDATQAEAMVRYMIEGEFLPPSPDVAGIVERLEIQAECKIAEEEVYLTKLLDADNLMRGDIEGAFHRLREATATALQSLSQSLASKDAEIERLKEECDDLQQAIQSNEDFRLSEKEAAEARIAEMEKALEPFAKAADGYEHDPKKGDRDWGQYDDDVLIGAGNFTVGDLRRARLARQGAKPEEDYFGALVARARAAAAKASAKFPQPNYVTLKIAEEAGEVVRGAVHYAENRMPWEEVEGEIVQLIAMLIRFVTEGDEINGVRPPAKGAKP